MVIDQKKKYKHGHRIMDSQSKIEKFSAYLLDYLSIFETEYFIVNKCLHKMSKNLSFILTNL